MNGGLPRALDALLVALLGRLAFWVALVFIAADAVIDLWRDGNRVLAVLAGVFAPLTFVVWPWQHRAFGVPLWIVLLAGVAARALASAAAHGRLSPGGAR